MSNEKRQPAGVPVGGQFATTNRAETGTELSAPPALLDPANAINLDNWEPGEDVDDDSLVREELRTLRTRVAELEKDQTPAGPVHAHIRAIAGPAGFHPTQGVMPAALLAVAERGDDDMGPYLLALTSDDLEHLYDTNVGQAVDQLEYDIRHTVNQRNAARNPQRVRDLVDLWRAERNASGTSDTEHLNSMRRRLDLEHAADQLAAAGGTGDLVDLYDTNVRRRAERTAAAAKAAKVRSHPKA